MVAACALYAARQRRWCYAVHRTSPPHDRLLAEDAVVHIEEFGEAQPDFPQGLPCRATEGGVLAHQQRQVTDAIYNRSYSVGKGAF